MPACDINSWMQCHPEITITCCSGTVGKTRTPSTVALGLLHSSYSPSLSQCSSPSPPRRASTPCATRRQRVNTQHAITCITIPPAVPIIHIVFSRSEYALISIRRSMFVMLRTTMKSTRMDVQIHQITTLTLLTVRRPSKVDGLCFARLGSSEFMNVVSVRLCGMTCLGCMTSFRPMIYQ